MSFYNNFSVQDPNRPCSICFEDFEANSTGVVAHDGDGEKHPVHADCIRPWIQEHPFCPSCQVPVQMPNEQTPRSLFNRVFRLPYSANRLIERTAASLATVWDRFMTDLHNQYGPARENNQLYAFYEAFTYPRVLFSPYYYKFIKWAVWGLSISATGNAVMRAYDLPNEETNTTVWLISNILPTAIRAFTAHWLTVGEMLERPPYSEFNRAIQTCLIFQIYMLTATLLTEKYERPLERQLYDLFA